MASNTNPVPQPFSPVTPHLVVKGCKEALEFYKRAFGATVVFELPMPDGRVGHAEMKINGGMVMLADEFPEYGGPASPTTLGGTTSTVHLYVADVDAAWKRAVDAGAAAEMPPEDMFWGDRYGKVRDPFGHSWSLAQHVRDVSEAEMQAALQKMASDPNGCG